METSEKRTGTEILLFALKLLVGPAALLMVCSIEVEGFIYEAQIALGTLIWMVMWWVLQPVPWAITSLLPLVVFPMTQALSVRDTSSLYGQRIFFWILGTQLLGFAILKHGLAKRFALFFLSIPGVGKTTYRLLFCYMVTTAMVSMFVSDASSIALMLPLGLSIQTFIHTLAGGEGERKSGTQLGTFFALGTLYAAVAGGITTIAGMPHNAVAVAQLEAFSEPTRTIGWFEWMMVGVPIAICLLIINYFILRFFFKPEIVEIPGGQEFLQNERKNLGGMSLGEKYVLGVFLTMAGLFTIPPLLPKILGEEQWFTVWVDSVISIWIVPPIILFLLFALPTNLKERDFVLNWKEASARAPWHILLMISSAVGVTDALAKFGFMALVTQAISDAQISVYTLPYLTGLVTSVSTNFISGVAATALYTSMLIPIAQEIGLNPASIAILVPGTAMGVIFPWAGATPATAFGFGEIKLKDMIKVGIVVEIAMILVTATICFLFAPIL